MTLRTIHIESYKAYKRRKLNMNNNFASSPDKLMGFDHNNPISDELLHRNQARDAERQKLTWKHQQELATLDRYYQREILYLTQKRDRELMILTQRHKAEMLPFQNQ